MYSIDKKLSIIRTYYIKNTLNLQIKNILYIFSIANGTLYNIINDYKKNPNKYTQKHIKIKHVYKSRVPLIIQKFIITHVKRNKQVRFKLLFKSLQNIYKISVSKNTIYRILKSANLSYKRVSRQKYNKLNISEFNKSCKQLTKKIRSLDISNILFIDESSIVLNNLPNYGWSKKNKICEYRERVNTKRYSLLMGITTTKIYYTIVKGSINKIIFNHFIDKITTTNNYILFMDNARIHHNLLLKTYMKENNIAHIFNVPYAPKLNPIELVFNTIKYNFRRNKYTSLKMIKKSIINTCTANLLTNTIKHTYNL